MYQNQEIIVNWVTWLKPIYPVSWQQCFADERDKNVFETTSWNTYLRYINTNRNLVYVLIFIFIVSVIEVKIKDLGFLCYCVNLINGILFSFHK